MRQRLRSRLHLVHWHEAEAAERARALRALGYDVDATRPEPRAFLRALREERPAAVVVDLERAPSMGRDLAVMVREQKATRGIPLVSAGGEPTKVERVRALLPDAAYAAWEAIGPAVAAAIAAPLAAPVAPGSTLAGYSGTPLPKKLGIKPPAVFVVGDVVNLRSTMDWFDNRPLFGKRIVVTRSRSQASKLVHVLDAKGALCEEIPTISISAPSDDYAGLDKGIAEISSFQWIVFTSQNGVNCFFDRLFQQGDRDAVGGRADNRA